ncbi:Uncharacterised protein [Klebsiella pneumoniae]|nr:Uncharacterised protein [Klebsiella pneumoniae]
MPPFRRVAATPYPAYGVYRRSLLPRPGKRCAGGQSIGAIPAISPGGGYALPGQGFVRPVTHLPICATETAGAGGLNIAETFPEGRGSPHGCGLRAVFCRDAASARPAACRDKSKGPRSGDFAGRSPGVQGAAATGRPLCAPCAIRDITQKINRERNLPGINIEVVALPNVVVLPNIVRTGTFPVVPLFRRVAATPYPAYGVYRRSSLPRPGKRCAGGQSIGAIPAISPGGDCALPGLRGLQAIFASQARQALRRRAIYRRRTRPTTTAGQSYSDDDSTLRGVDVVKHLLRQMHRGIGRRQPAVQRRVHDQLFQFIAGHPVVKRRA